MGKYNHLSGNNLQRLGLRKPVFAPPFRWLCTLAAKAIGLTKSSDKKNWPLAKMNFKTTILVCDIIIGAGSDSLGKFVQQP